MGATGLRDHVFQTYFSLRFGLGLLALAFPLILTVGGLATDVPVQTSFCSYYHTPMRNVFVGTLCIIGSFLFLYKGYSWQEDYALNVAGVSAILVALLPMDLPGGTARSTTDILHNVFSVLFLLAIGYVCIFRSADTLHLLNGRRRRSYAVTYRVLGVCMVVLPLATFGVTKGIESGVRVPLDKQVFVFAVEIAAVWTFGAYWLLKSKELDDTHADRTLAVA